MAISFEDAKRIRLTIIDDVFKLRAELIEQVRRGKLDPKKAEAEGERLALPPLLEAADPADFDPMRQNHWEHPMALVWIMTRDASRVREFWSAWRNANERWVWKTWSVPGGETFEGHWVERGNPVEHLDLIFLAEQLRFEGTLRVDLENAENEFVTELTAGIIPTYGLPTDGGMRKEIPPYQWRDLRFLWNSRGMMVRIGGVSSPGYNDPVVDRLSLLARWPAELSEDR